MKPWMVLPVALGSLVIGYAVGRQADGQVQEKFVEVPSAQAKEKKFAAENECGCGDVRTCPFGPGIVGQQQCRTDALFNNVWSRCEPK